MRTIPETIKQLLIVNILFFIGSGFLGDIANDLLALHYFKNDRFIEFSFIGNTRIAFTTLFFYAKDIRINKKFLN